MSILFNNPLLGASGQGPSADLGDTIEQSLRFGGVSGQKLVGSSAIAVDDTYTLSFWYKHTHNTTRFRGSIFTNDGDYPYLSFNADNGGYSGLEIYNGSAYVLYPPNGIGSFRQLRDPSAWLHCVIAQVNSTSFTIYINGEQAFQSTSQQMDWSNFALGGHPTNQYICDGMIAQLYHIDGTALTPTSFGRYNDDGVWVPQDYTGTYGTNGFHLTFDSSQANGIGHDSSGNGNNFTASNFDTADVALYSPDTVSSTGSWYASTTTAAAAFDGSTSTFAQTNTSSTSQITFTPSTAISYTSSVEVFLLGTQASINGGSYQTVTTNQYNTIASGSGTITEISTQGSYGGSLGAIRVDGTILVDNTDNDVDYNDTPTSNYATWNPLWRATGSAQSQFPNFHDGNLRIEGQGGSSGADANAQGTILGTGTCYVEMLLNNTSTNDMLFGLTGPESLVAGGGTRIIRINANGNWDLRNNDNTSVATGTSSNQSIWGFLSDQDAGTCQVFLNGTSLGTATGYQTEMAPGLTFQASSNGSFANKETIVNYGQMPWIHAPAGVTVATHAIETNNLPEPTIKNGKDYFDIVTYSGNASTNAISSLEFQPDFVWIKSRSHASSHGLYDSVRGVNKEIRSDVAESEYSFTDSLNSFDSNGFTLGTDTGNGDVNLSGRTYVAWCWKGGGTAVSNSNGDITSSVSANTDAGFSIVKYTGNTGDDSVGHGLTQAPEVVFTKPLNASSWVCYFETLGRNTWMNLNGTGGATGNITDYWGPASSWTTTTMGVRDAGDANNNLNGVDTIAYCWHSVEGYSKIGSFEGNNANGDGPFIYTGFRPSFLLCKSADLSTENWVILDTTRSTANVAADYFMANKNQTERDGSTFVIGVDFLANGFKCRGNNNINTGTGTYVYMAFAENPFGGENAHPLPHVNHHALHA